VRVSAGLRDEIEGWGERQADSPKLSEAIRRLVKLGLSIAKARPRGAHKGAATATALAAEKIARLIDPSLPEA